MLILQTLLKLDQDYFDFSYAVWILLNDAEAVGAMILAQECFKCLQYLASAKNQAHDVVESHYEEITT